MSDWLRALAAFFGAERYSQHSICLTNDWLMLLLYTAANLTIAVAYLAIGFALVTKHRVIMDLSPRALSMYGAFILLCSATHFSDVLLLFSGVYRLDIAILSATAAVSAVTAVYTVQAVWGERES
ncbi:hypothetical protein [Methylorubrum extorquens]